MIHGSETRCTKSTASIFKKPAGEIDKSILPSRNYDLNLLFYNIYSKALQLFVKANVHRAATALEIGFDAVRQNRGDSLF